MREIPQRDLRNNISEVLRAAEAGAEYTVTVGGRPVARLGPHRPRQWVDDTVVRELLTTPTDPTLLDDVRDHDLDAGLDTDPWTAT
jgi:prevent-host-death family protein